MKGKKHIGESNNIVNWGRGLPADYIMPEKKDDSLDMKDKTINWTMSNEFEDARMNDLIHLEKIACKQHPDGSTRHFRREGTFYSAIQDKEGRFVKLLSYTFQDPYSQVRQKHATKDAWKDNISCSFECDATAIYHLPQLLHSIIEDNKQ